MQSLKMGLLAVGATVAAFVGELGVLFPILLALIALDIIAGILSAVASKSVSSKASFAGMSKKALEVLLVVAAHVLEPAVGGINVSDAVAGFYIVHEGISILENVAAAGLPVPSQLRDVLATLRQGEQRHGS